MSAVLFNIGIEQVCRGTSTYQDGVHEAHSLLARGQSLLVDAVQHRREDGRGSAGATDEDLHAVVDDDDIVTDSADVGVSTAADVVDAALGD
jgi:hypothetical protein